ncbi:kinase-like domain-containing protein [Cantharellus anzutake]|uniref:kinase-like domain-containing protein n=1 Tax=Cantharellus anzutake TaxID=1750568 RepID=UPI0019065F4F|nr:kinase-like domain-containing protein [Cantharellus anzutake]KAF8331648.1 kinase-like domain-containing protein [Cantharellus anzutake]
MHVAHIRAVPNILLSSRPHFAPAIPPHCVLAKMSDPGSSSMMPRSTVVDDSTVDAHNLQKKIEFIPRSELDPTVHGGEALDQNDVLIEILHEIDLFKDDLKEAEERFFQRVGHQLKMLRGLDHPNIARFQGWMVELEDESWLRAKAVHVGCKGGRVMAYLSTNPEADRRNLVLGVCRGLSYLHSNEIVHGNLNPSNVHVDYNVGDRQPVPRISGFESSYVVTADLVGLKMEDTHHAPLRYTPPEVLEKPGVQCDWQGDIWSFGCTSLQILLGTRPYENIRNEFHIPSAVAKHVSPYSLNSTDPFCEALQSCLARKPFERSVIGSVVQRLELKTMSLNELESDLMMRMLQTNLPNLDGVVNIPTVWRIQAGGSFSTIYKGIYKMNEVCIKSYYSTHLRENERIIREMKVWFRLSHPNIVQLHGWISPIESRLRLSSVSNWCNEGNVQEFLSRHPDAKRQALIRGVAYGVDYLHSLNVVHGDINPSNIVMNEDVPQLCGFALSFILHDPSTSLDHDAFGTLRYLAPETFKDEVCIKNKGTDVWAFGCTAMEILSGKRPHSMQTGVALFRAIELEPPFTLPATQPIEATLVLCLKPNPEHRIDMKTVIVSLNH